MRRAVVFTAGLVIVMALPLALLGLAVRATLLDPGFYQEHFKKAEVFSTLSREIVSAGLQARMEEHLPAEEQAVIDESIKIAHETLTEQWFESRSGDVIEAALPYLSGERAHFKVTVPIADRLRRFSWVLRGRLYDSPLAHRFYHASLLRLSQEIVDDQPELPFGIKVQQRTWYAALRTAAPKLWVTEKLATQFDHVVDYLVDDSVALALHIPLYEQQDEAAAAIRLVVEESKILSFLQEEVIKPAIRENVEEKCVIPDLDVRLSKEEIATAFESVLSSSWVHQRRQDIITAGAEYLAGERAHLELSVSLLELKVLAAKRLERKVDEKVAAHYKELPVCTQWEIAERFLGHKDDVLCRPPALDYQTTKMLLGVDLQSIILADLDDRIPDQWTYDEARIRAKIGEAKWRQVQRAREAMREGIAFDEAQLRTHLSRGREDRLGELLELTRNGWVFSDSEIVIRLQGIDEGRPLKKLNQLRAQIALSQMAWPIFLMMVGLCLCSLILSQETWSRRLKSIGYTLVAAAIVGLAMMIVLHQLWEGVESSLFSAGSDTLSTLDLIQALAPELISAMAADILAELGFYLVLLLLLGGAILTAVFFRERKELG